MIAPTGTVYLGTVPWTSSYGNIWYEGMMSPQSIVSTFLPNATTGYLARYAKLVSSADKGAILDA